LVTMGAHLHLTAVNNAQSVNGPDSRAGAGVTWRVVRLLRLTDAL